VYLRKLLRSLQVFFPSLQDTRFALARYRQKIAQRLIEPDFAALRLFDWGDAPLFLDIGGNRGLATDAMHLLVPEARIIIFEPNPLLYRQLTKLYNRTPAVTCMNTALGCTSLDAALWVPVYRKWIFDGLGSLDRHEAAEWLNDDRLYFFDARHLRLHEYPCKICRLDDLDISPAFMKIDVQGYEIEVLRGAKQTLERCHPLLMIEDGNSKEKINFLQKFDYTIANFEGGRVNLHQAGRVNSFFLADKHIAQLHKRTISA
jgi:FkbM family methyltransferase